MPPICIHGPKTNTRVGDIVVVTKGGYDRPGRVWGVDPGKKIYIRLIGRREGIGFFVLPWDTPHWYRDPFALHRIESKIQQKKDFEHYVASHLGSEPTWYDSSDVRDTYQAGRSEEHTSELQSQSNIIIRL